MSLEKTPGKKIGIFTPIYHRNDDVEKFLFSMIFSDFGSHEVSLNIGINGADSFLRYFLDSYATKLLGPFKAIRVFDAESNIGKPRIINEMVADQISQGPLDFIVSIDSDFVLMQSDWLIKMVSVYESFDHPVKLGALCSNQKGQNCHVLDKDPIIYPVNGCKVITRAGNEGVAGGLLMSRGSTWEEIGGYHAHRLYASDDGHYALSCAQRGYVMGMLEEVSFYHPFSNDPGYDQWKQRATKDALSTEEQSGYSFKKGLV
jgi:hypothetical protein